jgi:hypothetical protein
MASEGSLLMGQRCFIRLAAGLAAFHRQHECKIAYRPRGH